MLKFVKERATIIIKIKIKSFAAFFFSNLHNSPSPTSPPKNKKTKRMENIVSHNPTYQKNCKS